MASVVGLLAQGQQAALAILAERLDTDFQGLSVAARRARKQGIITAATTKRLVALDGAAHFARHVTTKRIESLISGLADEMMPVKAPTAERQPDACSMAGVEADDPACSYKDAKPSSNDQDFAQVQRDAGDGPITVQSTLGDAPMVPSAAEPASSHIEPPNDETQPRQNEDSGGDVGQRPHSFLATRGTYIYACKDILTSPTQRIGEVHCGDKMLGWHEVGDLGEGWVKLTDRQGYIMLSCLYDFGVLEKG